eukprot:scaffold70347_cov58-Attheya_sp.AAC.2
MERAMSPGSALKKRASPLQSPIHVNGRPRNHFLNFCIAHLPQAASPTYECMESSELVRGLREMNDIGCRRSPPLVLSKTQGPPVASCSSAARASGESSACNSAAPIPSLEQSVFR